MPFFSAVVTGDTALVAAPTAGFIRVLGYQIMAEAVAGRVTLKSGSTVKANVGSTTVAGGGICCPPSREPYFDCAVGDALNVSQTTTGVNVSVNGQFAVVGN